MTPLVARFDLAGTREGTVSLRVQPGTLGLRPGLEIERVAPPTVTVRLVPRARRWAMSPDRYGALHTTRPDSSRRTSPGPASPTTPSSTRMRPCWS